MQARFKRRLLCLEYRSADNLETYSLKLHSDMKVTKIFEGEFYDVISVLRQRTHFGAMYVCNMARLSLLSRVAEARAKTYQTM